MCEIERKMQNADRSSTLESLTMNDAQLPNKSAEELINWAKKVEEDKELYNAAVSHLT